MRPPAEPGQAASTALLALVAFAVLCPWAMGAVAPGAILVVSGFALATSALALVASAVRGPLELPAAPLWPLASFLALALLQLVPLPGALHRLVAPGSFEVWHPANAAAASVLGGALRPLSLDPATTLGALALVGGLGLLAVLAAPALARPRTATLAASVVAAAGFLLSAYAIWARARFGPLLYGSIAVPTTAPFGPFVSKNHFAGWTEMAALFSAGLALGLADASRRRGRDWTTGASAGGVILAVVASLAMALASLASLSRGGTLALAAGACCLLALRLGAARGRGALVATLAPTLVLGGVLVGLVPQEAHERMRSLAGASFRLDTWKDTLRLAAASPLLGHGLGAFHDAYPRYKRGHGLLRVEHAENDYLETLAETGALGLGITLAGLALVFASASRAREPAPSGVVHGVGQGALAALAALAVHSLVDFNLRIPSNAALAALAAAAAMAAAGTRARPLSRALAAGLAAAALALAAASTRLPERPGHEARGELQAAAAAGIQAQRQMRLERASAALERAVRLRPAEAESWLLLAYAQRALGRHDTAGVLAAHALELDPQRPGLREAAEALAP